eukprot:1029565-Alexandrium_andersonii.AAC.1
MHSPTWENHRLSCGTSLKSWPCQSARAAPPSPAGEPSISPDARRLVAAAASSRVAAARSAAPASRRASAA